MSTEPGGPRRRLVGGDGAPTPSSGAPRRGFPETTVGSPLTEHDQSASTPAVSPRRAVAQDQTTPSQLRQWIVVLGIGAALVAMVFTLYVVRGTAPTTTQPEPAPSTATSARSLDPNQTDGTQPAAATDTPAYITSPGEAGSSAPTIAPSGPVDLVDIQLDDAGFALPAEWELYADEVVDGSRRLVRIREPLSDVRAQLVSLTSIGTDLSGACQALIDDQDGNYSNMVPVLPAAIGLASAEGTGVTCGFRGIRASDAQENSVTFTLLQRTSDGHSLVLRSTVPASVSADSAARTALFGISCQASTSFGVPLPLC